MTIDTAYKSGKSQHDENFPVASRLIAPRHRAAIFAFYRFARAADDAADHPTLGDDEKLAILDALEATLLGRSEVAQDAIALRDEIGRLGLPAQHALDLLRAFRQDVTKRRYQNWAELMDYCRYSAAPVGRFVLDVHGETRATWPSSDALCAALQIINHLQDCAKDYATIDRVYLPLDDLAAHGTDVSALAEPSASPQLRACLKALSARTQSLMGDASQLPEVVHDLRLRAETAVIVALARRLLVVLRERDPLSERVHLGKATMALTAGQAAASAVLARLIRRPRELRSARNGAR